MALTILTVNVHKGFGFFNRRFILPELRQAVRQEAADIVFLQEVLGRHRRHAHRISFWPGSQYEFLAESIWEEHAYGKNAAYPDGHHGNALLAKFPIVHKANHDISGSDGERRGLLHCVLEPANAREVHTICVHLSLRERHRHRQLVDLCALVEGTVDTAAPLIVAGDFNDWRCRAHDVLYDRLGLTEAFVATRGAAARSFPAIHPVLRLDRIYVRNAEVHEPAVLTARPWSHLSDHAPLAAEVRL